MKTNSYLKKQKCLIYGVEEAIRKYEIHPSILSIQENVMLDSRFSFSEGIAEDIRLEIKCLK